MSSQSPCAVYVRPRSLKALTRILSASSFSACWTAWQGEKCANDQNNLYSCSVHLFLQNLLQADLGETNIFWLCFLCVNFPEQHDILASHNENTTRNVTIALAHVDPLDCLVKHQIGELVNRTEVT